MDYIKKVELTPRLQTVADFVPERTRFVDIGTDHAYLPVWLLQEGKISTAIAADIREGPLSCAKRTAADYGTEMEFRLCDGLVDIDKDEVDSIAIAGMGGETMIHILSAVTWAGEKTLVLQPMSRQPELRQWLYENGFAIIREKTAQEGDTLYTVMLVEKGIQRPLTQEESWSGRQWQGMDDPLRGVLLMRLLCKVDHAIKGIAEAKGKGNHLTQKKEELEQLRQGLLHQQEEWTAWQQ